MLGTCVLGGKAMCHIVLFYTLVSELDIAIHRSGHFVLFIAIQQLLSTPNLKQRVW